MRDLSAFDTRDGMHDLLVRGEYDLSPTAAALLWYMLFNTIYDPGSRWFVHVNPARSSNAALSAGTRRSVRAVQSALHELEGYGFIQRSAQYGANGFQQQNLIKMTTPPDYCWAHGRRFHNGDDECLSVCS